MRKCLQVKELRNQHVHKIYYGNGITKLTLVRQEYNSATRKPTKRGKEKTCSHKLTLNKFSTEKTVSVY